MAGGCYFLVTSGQPPSFIGRKASLPGTVATIFTRSQSPFDSSGVLACIRYMSRMTRPSSPTLPHFCDAALAMSEEAGKVTPKQLSLFAVSAVPKIDEVFESFYRDYEQYRSAAAAWDAQYAPRPAVLPVMSAAGAVSTVASAPTKR